MREVFAFGSTLRLVFSLKPQARWIHAFCSSAFGDDLARYLRTCYPVSFVFLMIFFSRRLATTERLLGSGDHPLCHCILCRGRSKYYPFVFLEAFTLVKCQRQVHGSFTNIFMLARYHQNLYRCFVVRPLWGPRISLSNMRGSWPVSRPTTNHPNNQRISASGVLVQDFGSQTLRSFVSGPQIPNEVLPSEILHRLPL